jgi:hypothetical protein
MNGTITLVDLLIGEISSVDSPAHGNPGYMVTKALDPDEVKAAIPKFAKLIRDLQDAGDREGIEKAIKLCPPHIAGPALDQVLMADKIRDQYGLTKEKHSLRDLATGQFAPAATAEQAPERKSLFEHYGNVLPALRGE